jgi:hypothetical protein
MNCFTHVSGMTIWGSLAALDDFRSWLIREGA